MPHSNYLLTWSKKDQKIYLYKLQMVNKRLPSVLLKTYFEFLYKTAPCYSRYKATPLRILTCDEGTWMWSLRPQTEDSANLWSGNTT